jgi:hypothetical protein
MNDKILDRYTTSRQANGEASPQPETELTDDLGVFGWLRGIRDRAIMLELRFKDGSSRALGYAWLDDAKFDPSEGITLCFAGRTVQIKGRNLDSPLRPNVRLFSGIIRHRVPWIQEADGASAIEADDSATVIDDLNVKG